MKAFFIDDIHSSFCNVFVLKIYIISNNAFFTHIHHNKISRYLKGVE